MKDLIQEGRKIQENFKKNSLNEAKLDERYVETVTGEYIKLTNKVRTIGKFKKDTPTPDSPPQWHARMKDLGWVSVYFTPFETVSGDGKDRFKEQFEINVTVGDNRANFEPVDIEKFTTKLRKSIKPSYDPIEDAKTAFEYIKKVLSHPELEKLTTQKSSQYLD